MQRRAIDVADMVEEELRAQGSLEAGELPEELDEEIVEIIVEEAEVPRPPPVPSLKVKEEVAVRHDPRAETESLPPPPPADPAAAASAPMDSEPPPTPRASDLTRATTKPPPPGYAPELDKLNVDD